jgi:hypothetical protein
MLTREFQIVEGVKNRARASDLLPKGHLAKTRRLLQLRKKMPESNVDSGIPKIFTPLVPFR